MLLAYVDESYSHDLYWIAALVCPEHTLGPLTEALDDAVRKAARAYRGFDSQAELHGYDLFQGKGDWRSLATMPRARIGVYHDAFMAIASFDIEIIIRGMDVRRQRERYASPEEPHAVVLAHLLERVNDCSNARHGGQPVLVIADEVDQQDQYRHNLWYFQRFTPSGYRARRLDRIVDTIHFAPSQASRLVQAADLIAFLHCRINSGRDRDPRALRANDVLWSRIGGCVTHSHCWVP